MTLLEKGLEEVCPTETEYIITLMTMEGRSATAFQTEVTLTSSGIATNAVRKSPVFKELMVTYYSAKLEVETYMIGIVVFV